MTTEIITRHNTGFASGGVTCKLGTLCFYSSSVQADSFRLRNRQLLVAEKQCIPPPENSNLEKDSISNLVLP